jgi:NADH-quinone oxidoreductase subunit L
MYISKGAVPAQESEVRTGLQNVVYNKYYIDELYDIVFVKPMRTLSNLLYSFGEFFVDLFVDGTGKLVKALANLGRQTQTGSIGTYIFAMVVGIMLILFWNLLIR